MSCLDEVLTPEMLAFLDKLVASGKYRDREDALRELLRSVMKGVAKAKRNRLKRPGTPRSTSPRRTDTGGNVTIQLKNF